MVLLGGFWRWNGILRDVRTALLDSNGTVEEVLLAVSEQVRHDKLYFASRMNKSVVVFLKDEPYVYHLIENGVFTRDIFVQPSLSCQFPPCRSQYPLLGCSYIHS